MIYTKPLANNLELLFINQKKIYLYELKMLYNTTNNMKRTDLFGCADTGSSNITRFSSNITRSENHEHVDLDECMETEVFIKEIVLQIILKIMK